MTKASGSDSKNTLYCSFCGKSQHEVRKLIAGPTVFICDECVELCMDIIREENKSSLVKSRDGIPTPQEIRRVLDDYVIGQNSAKKVLSVAVHSARAATPVLRRASRGCKCRAMSALRISSICRTDTEAVSYTHLDVYKRQVLLRRSGKIRSTELFSFQGAVKWSD